MSLSLRVFVAIGLRFFVSAAAAYADSGWVLELSPASGKTEFRAQGHPSALKIIGTSPGPKGQAQVSLAGGVQGKVTLALDALDTGMSLRNRHMKEKYLEVAKYPEAALSIKKFDLPKGFENDGFKAEAIPFEADLTLHGVTKPVHGTAVVTHKGSELGLDSSFALKISDFQIAVPSFSGITVADEVTVHVESSAPLKAAK